MRTLILTLAACCLTSAAQAVDTLRYALITGPTAMEVSRSSLLKTSTMGEDKYFLNADEREVTAPAEVTSQDENLNNWTPMSIEALGYDIREVWRLGAETWTFGGIGFSR